MSASQREHARLHAKFGGRGSQRLLDERVSVTIFSDPGHAPTLTEASDIFGGRACTADAVVAGFVSGAESFPTEDGSLLFTDHEVTLTDVFRAPRPHGLFNGVKITVTRIGGKLDVEGRPVTADVRPYPPLEVGRTYLFFLRFLPRYKTFHAATPDSTWSIAGGQVRSLVGTSASDADLLTQGVPFVQVADWLRGAACR